MTIEEVSEPCMFDMGELLARLELPGKDLLMRQYGERALPILEAAMSSVPLGVALRLDLRSVDVIDASFADAALVNFQQRLVSRLYGNRYLILQEPNATVIENLEGALARRRGKSPLLACDPTARLQVVGHLERNLRDTWAMVVQAGVFRARDLADRCGIEINAASMRLHKLATLRLLARDEESTLTGRQHAYRPPA